MTKGCLRRKDEVHVSLGPSAWNAGRRGLQTLSPVSRNDGSISPVVGELVSSLSTQLTSPQFGYDCFGDVE